MTGESAVPTSSCIPSAYEAHRIFTPNTRGRDRTTASDRNTRQEFGGHGQAGHTWQPPHTFRTKPLLSEPCVLHAITGHCQDTTLPLSIKSAHKLTVTCAARTQSKRIHAHTHAYTHTCTHSLCTLVLQHNPYPSSTHTYGAHVSPAAASHLCKTCRAPLEHTPAMPLCPLCCSCQPA